MARQSLFKRKLETLVTENPSRRMLPGYVTLKDAADTLGVTTERVREMIATFWHDHPKVSEKNFWDSNAQGKVGTQSLLIYGARFHNALWQIPSEEIDQLAEIRCILTEKGMV